MGGRRRWFLCGALYLPSGASAFAAECACGGGRSAEWVYRGSAGVRSLATAVVSNVFVVRILVALLTMAIGSSETDAIISVRRVTLGRHILTNVSMAVGPDGSSLLFGLPELNSIGRFTIDSAHSQLIFG